MANPRLAINCDGRYWLESYDKLAMAKGKVMEVYPNSTHHHNCEHLLHGASRAEKKEL